MVSFSLVRKGYITENWNHIAEIAGGVAVAGILAPLTGGSSIVVYSAMVAGGTTLTASGALTGAVDAFYSTPVGEVILSLAPYTAANIDTLGCQKIESIP
jgi:hypothetical protein